jgi:epoxide hydrolase-like predicted phosphatase
MAIRAVAFDIGGVLERVQDPDLALGQRWQERLGLTRAAFYQAMASADPGQLATTGGLSESQYKERCTVALGLTGTQPDEFMADMWDWYCGELDTELLAFARSLRPRLCTAILSNSADGARREEQARYSFDEAFDPIIYSHEVGLAKPDPRIFELTCARIGVAPGELIFVDDVPEFAESAGQLGIHGITHRGTPETIAAISELIAAPAETPG